MDTFDYNNTVRCSTGYIPAKLMFGRELRFRLDLIMPQETSICDMTSHKSNCRKKFNVRDKDTLQENNIHRKLDTIDGWKPNVQNIV